MSCFLAVASAGWHPHTAHIPVLDHNGYQLDTPEVAHAKAAHFAAHAEARAHTGHGHGLYTGLVAQSSPLGYAGHHASHYAASIHVPVIGPHGVPLDTPEVAHAKAAHLAAHAEEAARSDDNGWVHYRQRRGVPSHYVHAYSQHIPVIGPHGVPLETPEVIAAKAHHAAAHAEANVRIGGLHAVVPSVHSTHHGILANPVAYAHGHHVPAHGHNGVPLDTPEVAAAKVHHAAAHAEARTRDIHITAPHAYSSHIIAAHTPIVHAHHIPAIGYNGVPLDTPEVAAAKAHHAAAHVEAHTRNGHGLHY